LLTALKFASQKHVQQKRKDAVGTPYINHPIEVAELLSRVGGVSDVEVLIAAILHDTVEDTNTSEEEIAALLVPE
jgi:guanosine-3',5'-bis(diphosphate) 3'-pyrophosphohydrolase